MVIGLNLNTPPLHFPVGNAASPIFCLTCCLLSPLQIDLYKVPFLLFSVQPFEFHLASVATCGQLSLSPRPCSYGGLPTLCRFSVPLSPSSLLVPASIQGNEFVVVLWFFLFVILASLFTPCCASHPHLSNFVC
jgi:hypothetical protein